MRKSDILSVFDFDSLTGCIATPDRLKTLIELSNYGSGDRPTNTTEANQL